MKILGTKRWLIWREIWQSVKESSLDFRNFTLTSEKLCQRVWLMETTIPSKVIILIRFSEIYLFFIDFKTDHPN